ncbi:MAG: hypothetical protein IJS38_03010 [Erysipelotrichaceae bacterium]|nr:hypothetical protein [Erysipelotrichaceae bacterium]MBQ7223520.1 hypothetical protein [Erysipelotrichaceae bacterium]
MNTYLKMQINTMIQYVNAFEKSCELAAAQDDGQIDKVEQRQLDKIRAASKYFRKELEKVIEKD